MSIVTAVELVLIVFCVLWNAFFVSAEYAFVSVRHTRLDELVSEGNRRARTVRKIVADPSHFIAAMQLGITLSSLALGALGEPAVARVLDSVFGSVSSWASRPPSSVARRVPRHLDPARRDRRDRAEVVHAAARRAGRARRRAADRRLLLHLRLVHHVPRLARPARHADARHQDDRRARGRAQRGRAAHAAAPGRAQRRARGRRAGDDRQGLRLLRHARRGRHGAAARHRRPARRAHADGGDGAGAAAPVHALSGLRRRVRQRARRAARAPAVRGAAERRRGAAPTCARCSTRRTSCPRPSGSATC